VADLRLEGSVALAELAELAELAGAVWEWLLAFASVTGLVVMRQMMGAERIEPIEPSTPNFPPTSADAIGTGPQRLGRAPRASGARRGPRGVRAGRTPRSSSTPGRSLAHRICSTPSWSTQARRRSHWRHQDEPVGAHIETRARSLSKSAVSRRFVMANEAAMAVPHDRWP
jgi:hypothetical protein